MKEKSDRENIFSKTDFFSLSHKQKQIFTRNKREGAVSCKALCELFIYPAPSVKRDRNGERKKKKFSLQCAGNVDDDHLRGYKILLSSP